MSRTYRNKYATFKDNQIVTMASVCRSTTTLGTSIMEAQLSHQQCITFDAVHHAVFVGYAA
jgi:hypothetical protein